MKIIADIAKGVLIAICAFIAMMVALYLVFLLIDGVHVLMDFIGINNAGEHLQQEDILNFFR